MKIFNLNLSEREGQLEASACVRFEDSDRDDQTIYIRTPKAYRKDFSADPHAFLVGCLLPALHLGEKRMAVDHEICPYLKEGLDTAMALLGFWTKGQYRPVKIEARIGSGAAKGDPKRAGMVMSGGMDSLAALRLNRLHYPEPHPAYVRDCFFIHGFDIGGVVARGMKYHVFDRGMNAICRITDDAGAGLIPVYTNIRHLCDERELWLDSFFGAVLAAVAHTFSKRIHTLFVGSSYDIPHLHPCGSHPLLDPEYSSFGLRIRHRDYQLSRLEKIKIVSEWDAAFQNFRVCLANVPDALNCGNCEKCVRTMAELTALGLLDKTAAFTEDVMTPDHISQFDITIRGRPPFYRPLVPLLRDRGRGDLADAIEAQINGGRR